MKGFDKGAKCTRFNRRAQLSHQIVIVVNIVRCHQHRTQHFSATIQMVDICARKVLASIAITLVVYRDIRRFVLRITNSDNTGGSKQMSIAPVARGQVVLMVYQLVPTVYP